MQIGSCSMIVQGILTLYMTQILPWTSQSYGHKNDGPFHHGNNLKL